MVAASQASERPSGTGAGGPLLTGGAALTSWVSSSRGWAADNTAELPAGSNVWAKVHARLSS